MVKPRSARRQRLTVSLDPELLRWTKGQVGVGKPYRSVAHVVEMGLSRLREASR